MRLLARLAALLVLPAVGSAQSLTVLDFDDLVGTGPMPAGYGGITDWGTWSYTDAPDPLLPAASGAVRIRSTGPVRRIEFGQDVYFGSVKVVSDAPYRIRLLRGGQTVLTSSQRPANPGGPPRWFIYGGPSQVDAFELLTNSDGHAVDDLVFGVQPTTLGTGYCFPNQINSIGGWGIVAASGSDVAADNDLTLHVTGMPQGSWGLGIVSKTQAFIPGPTGPCCLCLGGNVGRYVGPGQVMNSGTTGSFDLPVDLTRVPQPTGFESVLPGNTWNFQFWYRDSGPFTGGSATSHFTSAVSITFQ